MIQTHPSRGGETDESVKPGALARAVTIDEYRKNIDRPMLSAIAADRFRYECLQQPNWRRDMQLDEDYYDGHQLSSEILLEQEERGIPPIVTNLIGPTIDVVLGMEAKSRRDFVVRPEDDPKWDDAAAAMSAKLKTAERLSGTDHACTQAYKRQVKGGLGWVHVTRETDPTKYRFRAEYTDWKEIDFDPFSKRDDLDDARFLRRRKWFDRDHLEAVFPDRAQAIHELGPGSRDGGGWNDPAELFQAPMLRGGGHGPWRDYSLTELEFVDWDRDRLCLEEFWYRVWVRGQLLDIPGRPSIHYDPSNELHNAVLEMRRATLRYGVWAEMRLAYFVGPLCLGDVPSPHPFKGFPYVPFFGMREGRTGVPYGLIRRMRPMQDEVNARSSKMLWALSAKRVEVDADAVLDHDATRMEVARPDAYILLNPNRKPGSVFKVDDNIGISDQQYKVLVDRIQRLQDVGGVYQSMLGKKETGADSGIAIQSLVEQGATTLAPINENFVFSRAQVGERLLAYVIAEMSEQRNVEVQINSARGKRVVTLNKSTTHEPTGYDVVENDVAKARLKVVLDDMPATATFRQQQFLRIADMLTKMTQVAPQLAVKFMDLLVEASDIPNRTEFVDRMRDLIGVDKDPSTMTDEERQAAARRAQEMEEQRDLELRGAVAKITLDEQKASQLGAQTAKTGAETESVLAGIEKVMTEVLRLQTEVAGMKQDQAAQAAVLAANDGVPDKQQVVFRW